MAIQPSTTSTGCAPGYPPPDLDSEYYTDAMQGDYEEDNTFTKDSDIQDGIEQAVQNARDSCTIYQKGATQSNNIGGGNDLGDRCLQV